MLRSRLPLALSLLTGPVLASQGSSPLDGSVHTGTLRNAGVYSMIEGRWQRAAGAPGSEAAGSEAAGPSLTRVYDNTCLWTGTDAGTIAFDAMESCEQVYDDGRLPGGAENDYLIRRVTFAYMTFAAPGTVDVELRFYDTLGGSCAGFIAPTPPEPPAARRLRLDMAGGVPLPGDPTGNGSAWIVTLDLGPSDPFCLLADADGTGGDGADSFNWRFQHFNAGATTGGQLGGPLTAGEPLRGTR